MPTKCQSLPPLSPALQLLILMARLELSAEQKRISRELCAKIDDWSQFTQQARQRFVLPLVYHHLRRLAPEALPPEQLEAMKRQCLGVVQHNLQVAVVQRQLVRELLEPLGISHLFFKGYSLAARYYDEPGMRFSRDIDVLVPHERVVELLEAALDKGYQPGDPRSLATDRPSLVYLARVQQVITLVSPQGVTVEFHQRIDNTGRLYTSRQLLADAEPIDSNGLMLRVMPTNELFVYICLHHTKHYWSHLHWLVDMDAIQRHPSFDLEVARACAARRGLSATLEASLELYQAMSASEPWRHEPISANGAELLAASLITLRDGHDKELEMRKKKPMPDFAFVWQGSLEDRLWWKTLGWLRIFRPCYADYQSWPLPPKWQWVYPVTRPFRELFTRVTSGTLAK